MCLFEPIRDLQEVQKDFIDWYSEQISMLMNEKNMSFDDAYDAVNNKHLQEAFNDSFSVQVVMLMNEKNMSFDDAYDAVYINQIKQEVFILEMCGIKTRDEILRLKDLKTLINLYNKRSSYAEQVKASEKLQTVMDSYDNNNI